MDSLFCCCCFPLNYFNAHECIRPQALSEWRLYRIISNYSDSHLLEFHLLEVKI